jgi:hypothetical protein
LPCSITHPRTGTDSGRHLTTATMDNTSDAEDAQIIAHTKPLVSERRRLQNRLAQRKFRGE